MVGNRRSTFRRALTGVSMIEVLVTIVIIAFGLLGMAGLQMRLQSSEMESYQRTQALMLLEDLRGRLETNRLESAKYAEEAPLAAPVGAGMVCPAVDGASTRVQRDVKEWCDAMQGAGESAGGGRVGAMLGGRGCVEDLGIGPVGEKRFRISVAWQGLVPIAVPVEGCGANAYNGAGTSCQGDLCRRVVSTVVRLAKLN